MDEGSFLFQPGQHDTSNAVLRKDINDSFTQSDVRSLQRGSVFIGLRASLWNLCVYASLHVMLKQIPDLSKDPHRNSTAL